MILDGLLLFTGTSNGASGGITASAYTDLPTTGTTVASNILDLGVTSGIPASASGGGARDIGIGDPIALKLTVLAIVAFTAGSTIQLEIDGAVDNGSGAPSATWTTMWQSQAISAPAAGVILSNIDIPRVVPGQAPPRFLRMRFINGSTANTAGTIEATITLDQDLQPVGTTGLYSGYPAGINVAN